MQNEIIKSGYEESTDAELKRAFELCINSEEEINENSFFVDNGEKEGEKEGEEENEKESIKEGENENTKEEEKENEGENKKENIKEGENKKDKKDKKNKKIYDNYYRPPANVFNPITQWRLIQTQHSNIKEPADDKEYIKVVLTVLGTPIKKEYNKGTKEQPIQPTICAYLKSAESPITDFFSTCYSFLICKMAEYIKGEDFKPFSIPEARHLGLPPTVSTYQHFKILFTAFNRLAGFYHEMDIKRIDE